MVMSIWIKCFHQNIINIAPTVNPRLEGSVHGVVVHARKKPHHLLAAFKSEMLILSFLTALNIATALVSFTSL